MGSEGKSKLELKHVEANRGQRGMPKTGPLTHGSMSYTKKRFYNIYIYNKIKLCTYIDLKKNICIYIYISGGPKQNVDSSIRF